MTNSFKTLTMILLHIFCQPSWLQNTVYLKVASGHLPSPSSVLWSLNSHEHAHYRVIGILIAAHSGRTKCTRNSDAVFAARPDLVSFLVQEIERVCASLP